VDYRARVWLELVECGLGGYVMARSSPRLYQNREEVTTVLTEVFGGRCSDGGRPAVKRNE
jgi:hypothetical protein